METIEIDRDNRVREHMILSVRESGSIIIMQEIGI